MDWLNSYWNDPHFIPHGFCLLWRPDVLALHIISDAVIAASYFSIPLAILWFVRRRSDLVVEHRRIAILFSVFILGCGLTHLFGIIVLWDPLYVIDGWVKAMTALASIVTAIALWPLVPRLLEIPSPSQLAVANAALEREVSARRAAVVELEAIRANLETEVQRRTAEVQSLARRFEIATAGSVIAVSEQDEELRYTWAHNLRLLKEPVLGKTDEEAFGQAAADVLTPMKRQVLESREPMRAEATVPVDGVEHHFELQITPATVAAAGAGLLVASVDITEQKREQAHLQLILRELAHRAKNLLSLVDGIARQTAKAEGLPRGFVDRFGKRLLALGAAHDLLIGRDWRGVDLEALVRSQLAHILPEAGERISIRGPEVVVAPEAGQYLALAVHELATNATKYGALKQHAGRLEIEWRVRRLPDGVREVQLDWIETGISAARPARSGFGRQLLEHIVPRGLGGEAALAFAASAVSWRVCFGA